MKCEIISVGTELLLGEIVDTNSVYISQEMAKLGIDVFFKTTAGDNKKRLQETIKIAKGRADIIVFSGGLGPTEDDLTKQALCELLGIALKEDAQEVKRLENFFAKRERQMPKNNLRQALVPENAFILENNIGTASGLALVQNKSYYVLLPGPPEEMMHVFSNSFLPWYKQNFSNINDSLFSHTLKFVGISEADIELQLIDLLRNKRNPTLALLAKDGEIHLRLTAKAKNFAEFSQLINLTEEEIMLRVGKYYYGSNDDSLEAVVGKYLKKYNLSIATAESCTGGLIAKRITNIPGSSDYFLGGIVAYNNNIKAKILKVPLNILQEFGAVSEETAKSMSKGLIEITNADLAISVTGIAGPGGGSSEKPQGLVYISLLGENINICKKYIFSGNRHNVRWRTSTYALNLVKKSLEENKTKPNQ